MSVFVGGIGLCVLITNPNHRFAWDFDFDASWEARLATKPPDLSGDMSTGEWSPEAKTARERHRVVMAARWYVRCVEFGLRTDCSWFELREAVKVIAPEEVADDGE